MENEKKYECFKCHKKWDTKEEVQKCYENDKKKEEPEFYTQRSSVTTFELIGKEDKGA